MGRPKLKDYLFAGDLTDPTISSIYGKECGFENIDVSALLSLLKRNKVPSIFFDKYLWQKYPGLFNSVEFKAHYEKEHCLFNSLRNEWDQVRKEFLKAGIETMFIKSVGYFPFNSSNLDVLIRQSKRELAESILENMGYIQLHNVEEPYKTLFRKFSAGKSTSVIHLHNKVAWINPFHDEELLWERYRKSPEDDLVDIPSPEDSILILTAHWFYEDKEIKLCDILNISACLKEDDLNWEYMVYVARKMGWLNGLCFGLLVQSYIEKRLYGESLIHGERIERMESDIPWWSSIYLDKRVYPRELSLPFKLPKIYGKFLHFLKTLKDTTTSSSQKLYEIYMVAYGALFVVLFEKFKVNIRYQPPMLISISGVDGSGKSTYVEILSDVLEFCELRTKTTWSRVGSSNFLKPLSKLSKIFHRLKKGNGVSKRSENFEESIARRNKVFRKSPILRIIGLSLLMFEMLWQYFFKVTIPLFFNKVVICDRYIFDTLVDVYIRYGIKPNSMEGRIFKKTLIALTPTADIAYVLLISLEEACIRKKVDVKESQIVNEQINSYRDIIEIYNLYQIKTGDNTIITDISDKMIFEILTKYYKKW